MLFNVNRGSCARDAAEQQSVSFWNGLDDSSEDQPQHPCRPSSSTQFSFQATRRQSPECLPSLRQRFLVLGGVSEP